MLALAMLHWNDIDDFGQRWGRFALFMSVLGWIGFFSINMFSTGGITLKPAFKPINASETAILTFAIFFANVGYQLVLSRLGFSISPYEQIAYNLFAPAIEEQFFRGFLIDLISNVDSKNSGIGKFSAVFISSLLFAAIHQNYWNDLMRLLAVFGGGLIFGLFYITKHDITANILGHFMLNAFVAFMTIGQVLVR